MSSLADVLKPIVEASNEIQELKAKFEALKARIDRLEAALDKVEEALKILRSDGSIFDRLSKAEDILFGDGK